MTKVAFQALNLYDWFWINGNQWMKVSSRTAESISPKNGGPKGRSWDWFKSIDIVEVAYEV